MTFLQLCKKFKQKAPLDYLSLHGFVTAMLCGPQQLHYASWLTRLTKGSDMPQEQAEIVVELFTALKEKIEKELQTSTFSVPFKMPQERKKITVKLKNAAMLTWLRGFLDYVALNRDGWINGHHDDEFQLVMSLFIAIVAGEHKVASFVQVDLVSPKEMIMKAQDAIVPLIYFVYAYWRYFELKPMPAQLLFGEKTAH